MAMAMAILLGRCHDRGRGCDRGRGIWWLSRKFSFSYFFRFSIVIFLFSWASFLHVCHGYMHGAWASSLHVCHTDACMGVAARDEAVFGVASASQKSRARLARNQARGAGLDSGVSRPTRTSSLSATTRRIGPQRSLDTQR